MSDGSPPWLVTAYETQLPGGNSQILEEVRELRARILFDFGRRPDFADRRGHFADDQELDFGAWHFLARRDPEGPPLGYVRLSLPTSDARFQTRTFLGDGTYERLLALLGASQAFEHSRLVVEHRARKLGLGLYLNAVAIATAGRLGADTMIGISGTKDGQDHFHERFGFRRVPETRRYVEHYTEDVVVMFHRIAEGAGKHAEMVDSLRENFTNAISMATQEDFPKTATAMKDPIALSKKVSHVWRPVLLDPLRDSGELEALLKSGEVREVHDRIDHQLSELVTSREPSIDSSEIEERKRRQLVGRDPDEYGTWVWFEWSGQLVHVLPREEFRLVRTDRNRGKLERPEQRRLFDRRIGIIGLSVGSAAAVTMALEGIGGAFTLADHDAFSLSNLNRLSAGVADLGVDKVVLCARRMFEIDPYLDIELYPEGLTENNLDAFFDGLDLIVEECDTPWAKIAAREKARRLRIPLLMECNDRGMLDVERYDLEPDRPLMHGRLGDLTSADVLDLDRAGQIDLILTMVDAEQISPEMSAAFPELGRTLSAWPQLASGVALGGALVADSARRILLGQTCQSGRFYTELGKHDAGV